MGAMHTQPYPSQYDYIGELRWHSEYIHSRLPLVTPTTDEIVRTIKLIVEEQLCSLDEQIQRISTSVQRSPLSSYEKRIRDLYKLVGTIHSLGHWHSSPSFIELDEPNLAPLGVSPGYNDYDRGYLPQGCAYETHFRQMYSTLVIDRTFVFSCGMGSIQTALQTVIRSDTTIAIGKRAYQETQLLVSKFVNQCSLKVLVFDEAQRDNLVLLQILEKSDVILFDSCTLDMDALQVDIDHIFILSATLPKHITIILDNTVIGPYLHCQSPPENVTVLLVESLIKYYQIGLDLAASGIMAIINGRDHINYTDIETLRGTNGTNLNPFNLALLPQVAPDLVKRRLAQHQRNAALIYRCIENLGDIKHVGYGGLLFLAHEQAPLFINMVLYLSIARGISIKGGTSFGFNVTRLSLMNGGSSLIRLACGTETEWEAQQIGEIIRDVLMALQTNTFHLNVADIRTFFPGYYKRAIADKEELTVLRAYAQELDSTIQDRIV